jgi:hypothetical protein
LVEFNSFGTYAMKYVVSCITLWLTSLVGCAGLHSYPPTPTTKPVPETVLITYHVAAGKEEQLQQLLNSAWAVYRQHHLVFAEPHIVARDREGDAAKFIEIFTWVSHEAPDHAPEAVTQLWDQMHACCESRAGHPALEGGEIHLLVGEPRTD